VGTLPVNTKQPSNTFPLTSSPYELHPYFTPTQHISYFYPFSTLRFYDFLGPPHHFSASPVHPISGRPTHLVCLQAAYSLLRQRTEDGISPGDTRERHIRRATCTSDGRVSVERHVLVRVVACTEACRGMRYVLGLRLKDTRIFSERRVGSVRPGIARGCSSWND
jgi:hypothetical protein